MEKQAGTITDETVAQLRAQIGQELVGNDQPYIEAAGKDAIRHFAFGMGDFNPLWLDETYAKKSRFGGLTAPPCILYAAGYHRHHGLRGAHGLHAGGTWEWFRPIRVNDQFTSKCYLSDVKEKQGRFGGREIIQTWRVDYKNQTGELIASCFMWTIRADRSAAQSKGKYADLQKQVYTDQQIHDIERQVMHHTEQGDLPRLWSQVQVGDALPPLVKGPITTNDIIAYCMGWGGGGNPYHYSHSLNLIYRRQHPGAATKNPQGIPDIPARVHWEDDYAQRSGLPWAYDLGPQRISWMSQLMTDWVGDDGFLKKMDVQLRSVNFVGDTTFCKGEVVRKFNEGDEALVECRLWAENQRGEKAVQGTAVASLPQSAPARPAPRLVRETPPSGAQSAKCICVVDGGMIEMENGTELRYEEFHAPSVWAPGGAVARRLNQRLVQDKVVQFVPVRKDRYGRFVAKVWVDGVSPSQTIQQDILARGYRLNAVDEGEG
ncbi:MAG: MaoC family dehydratase N-terminal domain-containing protein [Chloroflexota bacterium]